MLALAAIACILSCSKNDNKEPSINKTRITLYVDETEKLTYSGNDECTWFSDNKRIADVNKGVVTANHVGTTTAVRIKAFHSDTHQIVEGWVSCGSHIFIGCTLSLPDGSELVMPRREAKKYLSEIEAA